MELDLADGYQLPASSRIITRARDYLVIDLPSAVSNHKPIYTRTAVILDPQADMRVIHILSALHYCDFKIRVNCIGIAKVNGRIRMWYGDPATFEFARRPLIDACRKALWPHDRIDTDPLVAVKMLPDGTLDRDDLAADDLLRVVPERYKLGLVHAS